MSRKRPVEQIPCESPAIGLKLTGPERDAIVTSRQVRDPELHNRIRNASSRDPFLFTIEELEDLHRGLAFDARQSDDKKRHKTIEKLLGKIEDVLDQTDDSLDAESMFDYLDDEELLELGARELFADLFGLSPQSPAGSPPPCPVTLDDSQRKTLCAMDTISGDIHKLLQDALPETQVFEFNFRQLVVISLAVKEAIESCQDKNRQRTLQEIAQRIADGTTAVIEKSILPGSGVGFRRLQGTSANVAYRLKITLDGSKPPIWRRIVVPDCTLADLHEVIQTVMGWTNSHLHMFEDGEDRFSDPSFELEGDDYDETQVYLSQLIANGCKKLRYWYDFGDSWWHTINIEKTLEPKANDHFPTCLKGVGACPPEDCGGIWGYYDFLEAVRDKKHERHEELMEWIGGDFDPEHFDLDEVNAALTG